MKGEEEAGPQSVVGADEPVKVRSVAADAVRKARATAGRRTQAVDTPYGHAVRSERPTLPIQRMGDVALIPTIQAAASRSQRRPELVEGFTIHNLPFAIHSQDLRRKVRAARTPNLVLFVVDASGSMAARKRMSAVKGAILSLLLDAYQKRDSVGMIAFRGEGAQLLLPPTNSVALAQRHLERLPTGGRTPLAAGLQLATRVLAKQMKRDNAPLPLLVLLSDGRANAGQNAMAEAVKSAEIIAQKRWSSLVIDCESGYPVLGMAGKIGNALRGEVVRLGEISAETVKTAVNQKLRNIDVVRGAETPQRGVSTV